MTATAADAFTTEVVRHALDTVAEEMRTSLHRTAMTVAVKDMLDYSCALFDARGRLLATALDLPTLLASMGPALRAAIDKWGDELAEGDVLMSNHPYQGGVHTSDINIFVPVFHDGGLIAFAGTVAHHSDWGGRLPGTCSHSNLSVFEEGVMYPSVKLEEGGRPNRSMYDVIAANVRNPALNLGDLRAQIAAARTGERGLLRIVGKYGSQALTEVVEGLIAHAARRTRQEIAAMPDGVYEAEGFLDDDGVTRGEPVRIHVRAEIAGEEISIDLSGSSGQRLSGMNCPLSTTLSDVHYAVRCLMPADVPFNEGCLEPVSLTVPEGNLFNPEFPAATSDRHHTSQRLNDVLTRALVQAVPERGSAGWYVGWPALICETVSPKTGDRAVLLGQVAGGAGANASRDGADALDVHGANCAIVPAETVEMNYALRVERYELRQDSGGAGARRGGLGIRADYRILGEEEVFFIVEAEQGDERFAPPGLDGGAPGAVGGLVRIRDGVEEVMEGKAEFSGRPGDVVSMRAGGGGGIGDPRARPREAVADDVRRGLVSPAAATDDYGFAAASAAAAAAVGCRAERAA